MVRCVQLSRSVRGTRLALHVVQRKEIDPVKTSNRKRLTLRSETLLSLTSKDLAGAAGGNKASVPYSYSCECYTAPRMSCANTCTSTYA